MSAALLLALALAGGPAPAGAPPALASCGPLDAQRAALAGYEESPLGYGRAADGLALVMFVSLAGTWTLLSVDAAGVACIEASGDRWRFILPPEAPA